MHLSIYNDEMDISVTEFKQHCLGIIRRVEKTGRTVTITRRGRVVARLQPPLPATGARGARPWDELRALGGRLLASPGESVMREQDFEALR
jgi:prevent-host-death family protein